MTAITGEQAFFRRRPVVLVTALLCCLIWGVSYSLVKIGYRLLQVDTEDIIGKFLFAGVRFTLAGALTIVYASVRQKRLALPPTRALPGIALLSLCQTILQYLFIYIGLAHTLSSKSSILNQVGVFLLVIASPLFFRNERLTVRKALGCSLGFAGIVLINLNGSWDWRFTMAGEGFVILSSLSAATGYLISKAVAQRGDPVVITGYQQLLGGLVLLVPGLAGGGRLALADPAAVILLLFLAVSVAVVYILWMLLLKYNDVSEMSIFKFGVPVVSFVTSGLLLQEKVISINSLLALLLVSGGIILVNMKRPGKKDSHV